MRTLNPWERLEVHPVPTTFTFMFEDAGLVQERDMTRDQLLTVIRYLMDECDYWRERSVRKSLLIGIG